MDEHVLNRRRVLLGTGAVAIGGVAVAASASSASANGDSGPSGSWVISRKDDPPGDTTTVTTVVSFAAGGVLISQDISPAASPFTGTWARRGDGGFQGTMWVGQPGPGGPGQARPHGPSPHPWQRPRGQALGYLPVLRLRPLRRRRRPRRPAVHRPPDRGLASWVTPRPGRRRARGPTRPCPCAPRGRWPRRRRARRGRGSTGRSRCACPGASGSAAACSPSR